MVRRLYHGTVSEFEQFKFSGIGIHFGNRKQAEERASSKLEWHNARIIAADVSIKRPLRVDDVGLWQIPKFVVDGLLRTGVWAKGDFDGISQSFDDDLPAREKALLQIKEMVQSKGYDGIVYNNTGERPAKGDSFIAFEPHQVKITDHGRDERLAGRGGAESAVEVAKRAVLSK